PEYRFLPPRGQRAARRCRKLPASRSWDFAREGAMQRIACAIALNTLLVIGGCGGDDGGRPSVSTAEDTVCDAVADVACFNMFQCCSEGEIENALGVSDPRTESECRDDVRAICERQKAAIDFSIQHNRVT